VFLFSIPFLSVQAQEGINGGSLCFASQNGFNFNLNTVSESLFAGQSQNVSGVITNNTDYDLQNGDVIVHIIKLSSGNSKNDYGLENDWVQRLVVADGISIESKASTNFDFAWNIPEKIVSGVYALDFYLVSNKAFIKAGSENHSFPAKRMIVSVSGGNDNVAYIKNNSLSMNGELLDSSRVFYFATGSSTPLHVGVESTGGVSRNIVVKYSLYNSTIIDDSHKVFEGQKVVSVNSKETSDVYLENLDLKKYAYYTALIELKDGDKSSFVTFGLSNTDKPFANVSSLYAKKINDTNIDIVGCVLLSEQSKKGALNFYTIDSHKNVVASGSVSVVDWKDVVNFTIPVSVEKVSENMSISLDIVSQDGSIISGVLIPVVCGDVCGNENFLINNIKNIIITVLTIITLLILTFLFFRKKNIDVLVLFLVSMLLPVVVYSQTGSFTSSATVTGQAYNVSNSGGTGGVIGLGTTGGGFIEVSWGIPDSDSGRGDSRGDTLPPTLEFTTQPTTIVSGQTATLYWQSYETSTCSAAGAWSGSKSISGNESTGVLNSDATYILSCAGWDGSSVEKSVTVTVTPAEQDVCPNISGSQTTVPAGYTVDGSGQCVLIPPTDVCPNIAGDQATVPAGYTVDGSGQCVAPTPPATTTDVCPNIAGDQATVPNGYQMNAAGLCVPIAPIDQTPDGVLDTADCNSADGWAYDPDTSSQSIDVHMYDGLTFLGAVTANQSRPDVNQVKGITGNHGFTFGIPESLKDNQNHQIFAYAINTNSVGPNPKLSGAPKTINCAPSTTIINNTDTGGGNGGGTTNNVNNSGFTLSADSNTLNIQFLGDIGNSSDSKRVYVNPVNGFNNPVELSIVGISPALPADTNISYSFDGRPFSSNPTITLTYRDISGGQYFSESGEIGSLFKVSLSKSITGNRTITLKGMSGANEFMYNFILKPYSADPHFMEI